MDCAQFAIQILRASISSNGGNYFATAARTDDATIEKDRLFAHV